MPGNQVLLLLLLLELVAFHGLAIALTPFCRKRLWLNRSKIRKMGRICFYRMMWRQWSNWRPCHWVRRCEHQGWIGSCWWCSTVICTGGAQLVKTTKSLWMVVVGILCISPSVMKVRSFLIGEVLITPTLWTLVMRIGGVSDIRQASLVGRYKVDMGTDSQIWIRASLVKAKKNQPTFLV